MTERFSTKINRIVVSEDSKTAATVQAKVIICERLYDMFVISDWSAHWPVFMLFSQHENTFAAENFKNRDTFLWTVPE